MSDQTFGFRTVTVCVTVAVPGVVVVAASTMAPWAEPRATSAPVLSRIELVTEADCAAAPRFGA